MKCHINNNNSNISIKILEVISIIFQFKKKKIYTDPTIQNLCNLATWSDNQTNGTILLAK